MAKRKNHAEETKAELSMTPMIDVVFLLLIFFMCATKFKTLEGKLVSTLPRDKGLKATTEVLKQLEEIRIRLLPEGESGIKIYYGSEPCQDFRDLYHRLQNANRISPEIPIKIDSEKDVRFKYVTLALNQTLKAGFTNIEFAGKPPDD